MREAIKKHRILICLELIFLLLLLPGCFRSEKSAFSDTNVELSVSKGTVVYTGEHFAVTPGVYQVRVKGVKQDTGTVFATANSEQHAWRTFRCNGANIYAQQETLDFEIYVLEKIDQVSVSLRATEGDALVESIEVVRTNWGSRMMVFYFLVGSLLLNLLVIFRDGIISGQVSKEKQVVIWGLTASVLIAYFPYMTDYFWSSAADIAFQWLRIEGLKETILYQNQFPVRVQSHWLYGHGYAVSAFYGDLFLWIPVVFRLIGFSLMTAYKMFVLVVTTMTAWIAYHSFYRCTHHRYAALFGSVIYMLAPYRIYNFYNRGAVGEYLAMTFFPLILCGMYLLYTEDVNGKAYKTAKWWIVAGLSCILQSHILSCEMSVLLILFVAILFCKKTFRKETISQLLQAAGICLLLNAGFWVPLLQMMFGDQYELSSIVTKNIQYMGTWFAEVFQLFPNKGGYQVGMYNAEPFQMGIASLIMLLTVMTVFIRKYLLKKTSKTRNSYNSIMLFWVCMIVITWFLSTRYFPWDFVASIPGIKVLATAIQFPTRLHALVAVFCAIGACFFYLWFEVESASWFKDRRLSDGCKKGYIATLLILALFSAVYHVDDIAYHYSPTWLYNGENLGSISLVNGEYLLEDTEVSEYYHHAPVAEEGLTYSEYEKQGTSIKMHVVNTTDEDKYMEVPLIGYIGYGIRSVSDVLDSGGPKIAEDRGKHGDLRVVVPANYEGDMEIHYTGLISFRIAELISLMTMLTIVVIHLGRRMRWKSRICN